MKKIYTPLQIYNCLKSKHTAGELIVKSLPALAFCTDNFAWGELLANQIELPSLGVLESLASVANRLQALRDTVFNSQPVSVHSAWRAPEYNKKIGGAPQSAHVLGEAIDFAVKDFPPSKVQTLLKDHSGGLGAYRAFTHIDIAQKRRWSGAD